jgi:hypothetical protein
MGGTIDICDEASTTNLQSQRAKSLSERDFAHGRARDDHGTDHFTAAAHCQ